MRGRALGVVLLWVTLAAGCGSGPVVRAVNVPFPVTDPAFERTAGALLGRPFVAGNRVTTLVDGDGFFPPMLDAIRRARRSITFETYIFTGGRVASDFADAFAERAAKGVRVLLILDSIGTSDAEPLLERMRRAGVQIVLYHQGPLADPRQALALNNRTHRRVLVVDGRLGFTGGAGIGDEWAGDGEDEQWRDVQVTLDGPIVRQLQAAFAAHWLEATGEPLLGDDYFPRLEPAGETAAQVFTSQDDPGASETRLGFLLAIGAARAELLITNPYLVLDDLVVAELVAARRRGVTVRIITAGHETDVPIARRASRARWGELLAAGVELWEFVPTMNHVKAMIVDRALVVLGSANLDPRSFHKNDELNLNVLDPAVAATHRLWFLRDLSRSRRVTYAEWSDRPWGQKVLDRAASLLSPQL